MKPIANPADLEEARSLPRAFVFLWVIWAKQARHSAAAVQEMEASWAADHPDCPAPVFCADLSDQKGDVWESVREWLRSEGLPVDLLTFGGNGALLWVRSGSVIASVPYAAGVEPGKLLAATRRIFQCNP